MPIKVDLTEMSSEVISFLEDEIFKHKKLQDTDAFISAIVESKGDNVKKSLSMFKERFCDYLVSSLKKGCSFVYICTKDDLFVDILKKYQLPQIILPNILFRLCLKSGGVDYYRDGSTTYKLLRHPDNPRQYILNKYGVRIDVIDDNTYKSVRPKVMHTTLYAIYCGDIILAKHCSIKEKQYLFLPVIKHVTLSGIKFQYIELSSLEIVEDVSIFSDYDLIPVICIEDIDDEQFIKVLTGIDTKLRT